MIAARGLQSATDAAVLTTTIAVQPLLTPDDLTRELPADKVAALDRVVQGSRAGTEIARIKIWHGDKLLYTADPHTQTPARTGAGASDELEEALAGKIEAEVISDSEEPDNAALIERYGTLLEVYVPILYDGEARPAGVFELYLPYQPVQASIRADTAAGGRAARPRPRGALAGALPGRGHGLAAAAAGVVAQRAPGPARRPHRAGQPGPPRRSRCRRGDLRLRAASALVLLDLDRFREVNDTLGHGCGDEVVLEMARGCARLARPGRPGGPARRRRVRRAAARCRRRRGRRCCAPRRCARRCARRRGRRRRRSSWTRAPASSVHPRRRRRTAEPCCATPTSRCTRPSAAHAGVGVYDRDARPTQHRAAAACSADLRRAIDRGRARAALPAQVSTWRPARCSASRRWSAGSTRARGLLPPAEFVQRRRAHRADPPADRRRCSTGPGARPRLARTRRGCRWR